MLKLNVSTKTVFGVRYFQAENRLRQSHSGGRIIGVIFEFEC